jgi:hypothetical protein
MTTTETRNQSKLATVGVLYRTSLGIILLGLVCVALTGQLLASRGLSRKTSENVTAPQEPNLGPDPLDR